MINNQPINGNPLKVTSDPVNGDTSIPAFCNLFEVTGKWLQQEGNGLNRSSMHGGFNLYAFNIEPQFEGLDYLNLIKKETLE